jgi:nucleoid-associated protein YgaU
MARVYLRRRVLAVMGLVVVLVVFGFAVVGARSIVAADGIDPGPPPASAATAAAPPAAAEAYLVRPGDTLWSIAAQLGTDGDVRSLVDELANRAGGPLLRAGQRIDLTGLSG